VFWPPVPDGPLDILISDGTVQAVGEPAPTDDAEPIDCRGAYALPGLFDSPTHLAHLTPAGDDSLAQMLRGFVEKGILQVRDVGGPLGVMQQMRGRIESGELLGPDIFFAGPMLEKGPLTWAQFNEELLGFTVEVNDSASVDSLIPALAHHGAACPDSSDGLAGAPSEFRSSLSLRLGSYGGLVVALALAVAAGPAFGST